jgi:hypothetical protein
LKCDEKPKARSENFKPESPFVVVCEGYRDAKFVCALLDRLKINNCDITFPQQGRDEGADGESGISTMVRLLSAVDTVDGIAVVRDADLDADDSFKKACAGYTKPFLAPKAPFAVEQGKKRSAVFLIPGKGKTGALEHLLLEAISATHAALAECIKRFEECNAHVAGWTDNKKAKLRVQCAIAGFCRDDPTSSLAYIWHRADNPIDIASPAFQELADFLTVFCQ